MKNIIVLFAVIIIVLQTSAQVPAPASDTLRSDALNVYMQTSDYVRREIPYINYVRDLKDADVYIISTTERTGSGGYEYTYYITGQYEYDGMTDTIAFVTTPDETTEGRRQKEISTLKMGLMRYVAKTPLARYIIINFSEPLSETVSTDKWNNWVFRTSVSGYLNGQKTYKSKYVSGNITANLTTQDWKINLNASYMVEKDEYEIGENIITSDNDSKSFNGLIVKSISDHWSYGGTFSLGASSYSNEKLIISMMPGIEYDIFPYSQSTRRQFRILYKAGYNYVNYIDTTIYNKTKEDLWMHSLTAAYEIIQKWGSVDFTLSCSNYFHDWSKNNLGISGYASLRIIRGLSFNISAGISIIHDQLNLVKGGATPEQVLLRQKEVETQYSYRTSMGFSYTFGSIYNNVVNPRFGSSGGGVIIYM
ncbi:MAG: hypothetical protein JXB19_08700 [Bacteroidales bacterium]|nr:hypothetical protein [Bacteroidales bacterium]